MPDCQKFYEGAWSSQDPARLRAIKVLQVTPGADAKHMTITVDDHDENGNPSRTFRVSWTGTRWIIG
jgi:hypothetical protein